MAHNVAAPSPYHAHVAPSSIDFASSPASSRASASGQTQPAANAVDPAAGAAQPVPKARPRFVGPASREYARCDLCGESLGSHTGQFPMVSPLTAGRVSVCRTCRRAALSEGYRSRA